MTRLERAQRRYDAALKAYKSAPKGWKNHMLAKLEQRTGELLRAETAKKKAAA